MSPKLEAKVKEQYVLGPVIAFSGYEFVRTEWRAVPAGFEPAALVHPLLDVREVGGEEIRVAAQDHLADTLGTADAHVLTPLPDETVAPGATEAPAQEEAPESTEPEEAPEDAKPARRKRKA